MPIKLITSGGGSAILTPTTNATDYTLTVPAVTANVVTTGDSNSVTAGMIAQPLTYNDNITISASSTLLSNIPSWVRRVTVTVRALTSNTGGSVFYLRLGNSGGLVSTGYTSYLSSVTTGINAASSYTVGFPSLVGTGAIYGSFKLHMVDVSANRWICDGTFGSNIPGIIWTGGELTLTTPLTSIGWGLSAGSVTAGIASILYE